MGLIFASVTCIIILLDKLPSTIHGEVFCKTLIVKLLDKLGSKVPNQSAIARTEDERSESAEIGHSQSTEPRFVTMIAL